MTRPVIAIEPISLNEFQAAQPWRAPSSVVKPVACFKAAPGECLGVVLEDAADHDFGFVVLAPDAAGVRRATAVGTSMPDAATAETQLRKKLHRSAYLRAKVANGGPS